MKRRIMCVEIQKIQLRGTFNQGTRLICSKQYGYHNMYNIEDNKYSISKCYFVDTYPNFNLEHGYGRIIQYQWNKFLRKIKNIFI